MKYKFEYGVGQEVEIKVEVEEKEMISLLLRGEYGLNVHLHREHTWLYAEFYRQKEVSGESFALSICVDELKEIYRFLVTFIDQPNVKLFSDYWSVEDYENSKVELVERCVRKDSLFKIEELKEVEGITVIDYTKEEEKGKQKPLEKKGKPRYAKGKPRRVNGVRKEDDCPY